MAKGWTMPAIDEMDICYFLRCWRGVMGGGRGASADIPLTVDENGTKGVYIDQLGLF